LKVTGIVALLWSRSASARISVMGASSGTDADEWPAGPPGDYDELTVSEWGLDWADISQIRAKLALSPTERLRAAQDLINAVIRIRAQNGLGA
jgi:hypothetical protein